MASTRPRLQMNSLPALDEEASSATASPARGRETRNHLLSKLRSPPLVHSWDFWHEKPAPKFHPPPSTDNVTGKESNVEDDYDSQLTHLHSVADVRAFWSIFNNISVDVLPIGTSIHLFHAHIKPLWEDPRNALGGCWSFRVSKQGVARFFQAICLLAIGEHLQEAVFEKDRTTFKDDICGVSVRVRPNGGVIQVWNRDAKHEAGIQRVLQCILANVPAEICPPETGVFYKAHNEHDGFNNNLAARLKACPAVPSASTPASVDASPVSAAADKPTTSLAETEDKHAIAVASVEAMERQVERVRRILDEVQVSDESMRARLNAASTAATATTAATAADASEPSGAAGYDESA